ncbi:MAG: hypothetical protein ACI3YD_05120 [Alloprevotella sp.]
MKKLAALLAALGVMAACSDDPTPLPDYQQTLADLPTDPSGCTDRLILDNGSSLSLTQTVNGLKADTLYRVLAMMAQEGSTARLRSCSQLLAPPVVEYRDSKLTTDAVSVVACWQTMRYINLQLSFMGTAQGTHLFGFHRRELVENADGSRTLHVLLLHDKHNDPAHYSRQTFLSLPLLPLQETLRSGTDSLHLTVGTPDGERTYRFGL